MDAQVYYSLLNGTYTNIEQMNKGGGGTVYRAYHTRLQQWVVLKKMHRKLKGHVNSRAEVDILKGLHSQYLPKVFDIFEENEDIYTAMEYIPGLSLQQLLDQGQRFSQEQVIKYVTQLTEVLAELHSQRTPIVHSDIKPANIMVTPDDNICLIDFNISGILGEEEQAVGFTKGYSAPEQEMAYGFKKNMMMQGIKTACPYVVDTRSDVYSVGMTAFRLLTGISPDNMQGTVANYVAIDTGYNDGLIHIMIKATNYDPNMRYQSAIDMHRDMLNINKIHKSYHRRIGLKITLATLAIVAVLGSAFAGYYAVQRKKTIKKEQYEQKMELMQDAIVDNDGDALEEAYDAAIKLNKSSYGAYYYKLVWLYNNGNYKDAVEFAGKVSDSVKDNTEDEYYSDYNYILGSCYFEMEEYASALIYMRTAKEKSPNKVEYYRDYAISCVKVGNIIQAKEILKEAKSVGVDSAELDLILAEINYQQKTYSEALEAVKSCVENSKTEYLRYKAILLEAEILSEIDENKQSNLDSIIKLLEDASKQVSSQYKPYVLERLVFYYSLAISNSEKVDSKYCNAAENVLYEIISEGWANKTTYDNLYILYKAEGNLEKEKNVLLDAIKIYDDDYTFYKKLSYTEYNIQIKKEKTQRDYSDFFKYYENAAKLYESSKSQDTEMTVLKNKYDEIKGEKK